MINIGAEDKYISSFSTLMETDKNHVPTNKRLYPLQAVDLFYDFYKDKTALYCSHRMSSTKFCDSILVLANGSLVEYGGHKDLMKEKGLYYKMYTDQASAYRNPR